MLSLNHGTYPFVTSRDVLASSMLSDAGIGPTAVREVLGVMRTYPIRVAGNSGPMWAPELQWSDVAKSAGYEHLEERTTVTNRVRRVSELSWEALFDAVMLNRPTGIFITFADYINAADRKVRDWNALSQKTKDYIENVERQLNVPVYGIGTGDKPEDFCWMGFESYAKFSRNVVRAKINDVA